MTKGIYLSIPEKLLAHLKKEQSLYAYTSVQEVIIDALREKFMRSAGQRGRGNKRGRPKEFDEIALLTRKHIFSKKGKAVDL